MYSKITYQKKRGEYIMEMHERIKNLRKNHLKLTQEAFGERLGVSRSVINNIERNVLARPEQKLSLIKLICKEFSVNEDWILNGNEPIYVETVTFSLDEFMKQRGATELELQIVKTYFDLEPDTRKMLFDHFKNGLAATHDKPAKPTRNTKEQKKQFIVQEADEFAELAREQFISEKKQESKTSSVKKSDAKIG